MSTTPVLHPPNPWLRDQFVVFVRLAEQDLEAAKAPGPIKAHFDEFLTMSAAEKTLYLEEMDVLAELKRLRYQRIILRYLNQD